MLSCENELGRQKREAYQRLAGAWRAALSDGIEADVLAHVALFAALSDLVDTYGERAVAGYAERLPERIVDGEFTLPEAAD